MPVVLHPLSKPELTGRRWGEAEQDCRLQLQTRNPELIITNCRSLDEMLQLLYVYMYYNRILRISTLFNLCFNPSAACLSLDQIWVQKKAVAPDTPFFSLPHSKNYIRYSTLSHCCSINHSKHVKLRFIFCFCHDFDSNEIYVCSKVVIYGVICVLVNNQLILFRWGKEPIHSDLTNLNLATKASQR